MDDQSFAYYQHSQNFDSYSSLQYPQPPYDPEYTGNDDNPFADSGFIGAQPQDGAPSWSTSFATPDTDRVSLQRRGAVSGAVPEQSRPEVGGNAALRGLRIDTSCGDGGGGQHHVQEATANLGSPLNVQPQHLDSATTPTSFPPGPNTYDNPTAPTNYDMNHNNSKGVLLLPLAMSQNPPYFLGHQRMYDQQLSQPSALSGHPNQLPQDPHRYTPSRSPQLHIHPSSAPPYGSAAAPSGLAIPYTPSSIASGSVRSASPASTAATSAQPLDFSTYASPVGEYDMGPGKCAVPASSLSSLSLANGSPCSPTVPMHSPVTHQLCPLTNGPPHSLSSAIRSSAGSARSATGHSTSPIRRRANKQRLDDARRKEICTYARDRPKARQEDIALKYGVERSTISKILKHKDKWLSLDTNPRKSIPIKHSSPVCVRPSKFPEIETELLKWVRQCQASGTTITDTRIKAKAKECAAEIGLPEGKFKASSGWIENFKIRNNLTRRSQDERDASPANEPGSPEHVGEDEDMAMPASQSTKAEESDSHDAGAAGQDSFNSLLTVSTGEAGLLPQDTSFSTFSADSMMSGSQDLGMFQSNTPLSSATSSFASSPSGALPQCVLTNSGLRSRGHSYSIAMRAVGPSCTPSGSPQSGASPVQPLSPARLDMRFTGTPTSASIPRFPSPLSASTSVSGNPLIMLHSTRQSPVSQKHSRHPSDASGFSYDVPSQSSTDFPNGMSPPLFESPPSHQILEALDTVLKYLQHPQTAEIASPVDRSAFAAVRARLAERLAQSPPDQHQADAGGLGPDNSSA